MCIITIVTALSDWLLSWVQQVHGSIPENCRLLSCDTAGTRCCFPWKNPFIDTFCGFQNVFPMETQKVFLKGKSKKHVMFFSDFSHRNIFCFFQKQARNTYCVSCVFLQEIFYLIIFVFLNSKFLILLFMFLTGKFLFYLINISYKVFPWEKCFKKKISCCYPLF